MYICDIIFLLTACLKLIWNLSLKASLLEIYIIKIVTLFNKQIVLFEHKDEDNSSEVSCSFLSAEYDLVYQVVLSRCTLEKFTVQVTKKNYFVVS